MRDIESQAKLGRVLEVGRLQSVVESMLDNLLQDPAAVLGLTAIKGHDDYTLNHSINVCILSISLGTALGLDQDELHSLGLAALLYDIGKVRVPEDVLLKSGPLTADEWALVKQHCRGRRRPAQAPAARRQDADGRRLRAPPAPRPDGLSRLQRRRAAPLLQDRRGLRCLRRDDHQPPVPPRDPARQGARRADAGTRARPTTPASPSSSSRCSASIRWEPSSRSTTVRLPSCTESTTTTCCTRASRCSPIRVVAGTRRPRSSTCDSSTRRPAPRSARSPSASPPPRPASTTCGSTSSRPGAAGDA